MYPSVSNVRTYNRHPTKNININININIDIEFGLKSSNQKAFAIITTKTFIVCEENNSLVIVLAREHMQMDRPPSGYRPNFGICLVNSKNEVFVASRLNLPGEWQMPQGAVEDGEEPKDAALRELLEETGIGSTEFIGEVPNWLTYDFPPPVKAKIERLWGGEWKGQAQKWFLLRFNGDESEINLDGDGTKVSYYEWRWMLPEELRDTVVDYKRDIYEEVFKCFAPYLN